NIARVIAAGTLRLADGSEHPYFAMELVDGGRPLTHWARETGAPLATSMRVFAAACDAIGHGHRRGVLHLDIKPGNLLVSASGEARVIDYGIARSIDDGSADRAFVGTPQYMAPERFRNRGGDSDSRADVYSLGAVLYEILTGRLPYAVHGASAADSARIAQSADIPHPARIDANTPRALGDIAMKCLSKDRDRRYGTASEIADELRRWIADEPVLASPEGAAGSAMRVLRRHRVVSGVSLVALLAVISAAFVALGAALDARDAAERERREAARANQRAASAAFVAGNLADATKYLNLVPAEHRGWEAEHLTAGLARFELLAHVGSEILRVAVARDSGEDACGVTGGFLAIADPTKADACSMHDLRREFSDRRAAYFPSLDISPDGSTVLAVLGTRRLVELDRRSGAIREIRPDGRVDWAKYAGNDLFAVEQGHLTLIDRASGSTRARLLLRLDARDLFLSADARLLLAGLSDGSIALYDIDPAAPAITERWRTATRTQPSRAVALSPDGRHAFAAWRDSAISRIDCSDGRTALERDLDGGSVYDLAISPDGSMLVASSWTNVLRVIDAADLGIVDQIGGTFGHIWDIAFSADGRRIYGRCILERAVPEASRPLDEWLAAFDVERRGATRDLSFGSEATAAIADGSRGFAIAACTDGSLRRLDLRSGALKTLATVDMPVARIAERDGSLVACDQAGNIARLDPRSDGTLAARWRVAAVPAIATALAWSPDGAWIACGGGGEYAALLHADTGATAWIRSLPYGSAAPDRRRVGQPVFLDGGSSVTFCMYASEAEQLVLAVSDGRTIRRFAGHSYEGESFVQHPRSDILIGAGTTGYVMYFNEQSSLEPITLARDGGVLGIAEDGSRLVFASRDGSCRVASVDPVQELMRLDSPPGVPLATCIDVREGMVSVVTSRGTVRSWTNKVAAEARTRPVPNLVEELKRRSP
ncbi:MAG: protein kinase domain-containing protein, partial [Planctomycetota bacterium]